MPGSISDDRQSAALLKLLAADKATRVAAAAAENWLDLYRRAAGETLSEVHLDLLLKSALEAIANLLGADAASLLLANESGTALIARAAYGLTKEVDLDLAIPAGEGASGPVLSSGAPRIIDDLFVIDVVSDVLRSSEQRSYVGVPLSSGGKTFGVLHATCCVAGAFDAEDVELLQRFADPIATAIERVRIIEAHRAARSLAEKATRRIRGLQRVTSAFANATSSEEICQIILSEAVPEGPHVGEGAIWILHGSRLLLVAGRGVSAEYPEIPLDPSLPAAQNLRDGVPLFIESRAEISRRWPILSDGPTTAFASLPLLVEGRRLGVMAIGYREEHAFEEDEREYLAAVAEQAASALARAEARHSLQEARDLADARLEQLRFLANASERLSGSLDLGVTLQVVAELGVPRVTDRCALYLVEDGSVTKRVLAPELSDDEMLLFEESTPSGGAIVQTVLRTGLPEYIDNVEDSMLVASATSPTQLDLLRRVGFGGMLIVPLRARGRVLGALAFVNRKGRPMLAGDRSLADELAARAAVAIDNAMLYEREHQVAQRLTEALLPARLPSVKGVDVAVKYQAGSKDLEVGGDFYDLLAAGEGAWVIIVGDVQGKGVEAATLTGLARHTFRACVRMGSSPAMLLHQLNQAVLERNVIGSDQDVRFCTAAVVRLSTDNETWSATVCSAGHPLPLLRQSNGAIRELGRPALLLGLSHMATYVDETTQLDPGCDLLMYTDGISDRLVSTGVTPGSVLADIFSGAVGSASEVAEQVMEGSLQYPSTHRDDMVSLIVRFLEKPEG